MPSRRHRIVETIAGQLALLSDMAVSLDLRAVCDTSLERYCERKRDSLQAELVMKRRLCSEDTATAQPPKRLAATAAKSQHIGA